MCDMGGRGEGVKIAKNRVTYYVNGPLLYFSSCFSLLFINRFYLCFFSGYRALRSVFAGVGDLSVCHPREVSRGVPVDQLWCHIKVSFPLFLAFISWKCNFS